MNSKEICLSILDKAGIEVNGSKPWSIHVHNEKLWDRVVSQQGLGLGEAYMDGWWECEAIDQMLTRLLEINVTKELKPSVSLIVHAIKSTVLNRQTKNKAASNAKHHYNIGNDLYQRMLDPEMAYSCAYWADAKNLKDAQLDKFDLIAQKLQLKPGMRILDVGCGWGGFLRYVAANYGVTGVGISPADNQIAIAKERNGKLPLEYIQQDYRQLK